MKNSIRLALLFLAVALFLVAIPEAWAQQQPPVLAKVVTAGEKPTSIIGELGRENDTHIELLDLTSGKPRSFEKGKLQSIKKNLSDREVISSVGLTNILAWKIKRVVHSGPIEGTIAKVGGAVAYITLGSQHGTEEGQEIAVYRGDEDVVDPKTGEVIGRERRHVADLRVIDVQDRFSKAKILGDLEVSLEIGDTVEPAVSKRSIAILPLVDGSGNETTVGRQLAEELTTGLVNGTVSVVERTLLEKTLRELDLQHTLRFDAATAQRVGRQLGAYAVLAGTIMPKRKYAEAQIRLIKVESGEILVAVADKVEGVGVAETAGALRRNEVYLADITPVEVFIATKMVTGIATGHEAIRLLNRRTPFSGFWSHHALILAPPPGALSGHAVFHLNKKFKTLHGAVGVTDWVPVGIEIRPLTFRAVGDGRLLWKSRPLRHSGETQAFHFQAKGVEHLQLFMDIPPGGRGHAWGGWVDPILAR